ncbi:MAG TPA: pyridoxamine 5'-phosphate oxidase family protein [Propionibacteriaceae bacterium]|nr:pyridoxamine 5'-phosphate oxidase family protein [Propionibacteriaceae bacterium]
MIPEYPPPSSAALPPPYRVLSVDRCQQLLAEHHVGRMAWAGADGLQLLPVSYAFHRGSVVFRTSPYGVLSELVRPADVIFEVDELDPDARTGWSVVVAGRAQAVAEPRDLVQLWTVDGVIPWADGVRTLFIEVTPRQITGRQFGTPE